MTAPLPAPPRHPRRLVFLGTPEMAVPPLEALHAAGFDIALVVTGADKRRGRRAEPTPTPVKAAAVRLGLTVTHDLADVPGVGADLGVVVAYGRILRRPLLEALPMVNLHFSLLPRWRGAAPVERAILAGDERTGVCVMAVEEGLDTGGVYAHAEVPIGEDVTAGDLGRQLTGVGSELLVRALHEGLSDPDVQVGEPVYAHKITPGDLRLQWNRPAVELARVVRVGGAWTTFRAKRLKIGAAAVADPDEATAGEAGADAPACPSEGDGTTGALGPGQLRDNDVGTGDGVLRLVEVQPEGKAAIPATAWRNGAQPRADERFDDEESP